ncbi:hypothetical protein AB6A40_006821 [Gnathostoma spinigerum]|uniref:Uncharacterized protein n=1 Tax=Gnathostoma spinigerum TaxID=75299 RepID=A0ABD6ELN2_9BILA
MTSNRVTVGITPVGLRRGGTTRRKELHQLSKAEFADLLLKLAKYESILAENNSSIEHLRRRSSTKHHFIEKLETSINSTLPFWDFEIDKQLYLPAESALFHLSLDEKKQISRAIKNSGSDQRGALDHFTKMNSDLNLTQLLEVSLDIPHPKSRLRNCELCQEPNHLMFCDTSTQRCVGRVLAGSNCRGFSSSFICLNSQCTNGTCIPVSVPTRVVTGSSGIRSLLMSTSQIAGIINKAYRSIEKTKVDAIKKIYEVRRRHGLHSSPNILSRKMLSSTQATNLIKPTQSEDATEILGKQIFSSEVHFNQTQKLAEEKLIEGSGTDPESSERSDAVLIGKDEITHPIIHPRDDQVLSGISADLANLSTISPMGVTDPPQESSMNSKKKIPHFFDDDRMNITQTSNSGKPRIVASNESDNVPGTSKSETQNYNTEAASEFEMDNPIGDKHELFSPITVTSVAPQLTNSHKDEERSTDTGNQQRLQVEKGHPVRRDGYREASNREENKNESKELSLVHFSVTIVKGEPKRRQSLNRPVDGCKILLTGANMPNGFTQTFEGRQVEGSTAAVVSTLNPETYGPLVEFHLSVFDNKGLKCQQTCLTHRGTYSTCNRDTLRLTSREFRVYSDPIEFYESQEDALENQWSGRGYYRRKKNDYILFKCPVK